VLSILGAINCLLLPVAAIVAIKLWALVVSYFFVFTRCMCSRGKVTLHNRL